MLWPIFLCAQLPVPGQTFSDDAEIYPPQSLPRSLALTARSLRDALWLLLARRPDTLAQDTRPHLPREPRLRTRIVAAIEYGPQILQWAVESAHCPLMAAARVAARAGNLKALEWCVDMGVWARNGESLAVAAAECGRLEVLQWAERRGLPFHKQVRVIAVGA